VRDFGRAPGESLSAIHGRSAAPMADGSAHRPSARTAHPVRPVDFRGRIYAVSPIRGTSPAFSIAASKRRRPIGGSNDEFEVHEPTHLRIRCADLNPKALVASADERYERLERPRRRFRRTSHRSLHHSARRPSGCGLYEVQSVRRRGGSRALQGHPK